MFLHRHALRATRLPPPFAAVHIAVEYRCDSFFVLFIYNGQGAIRYQLLCVPLCDAACRCCLWLLPSPCSLTHSGGLPRPPLPQLGNTRFAHRCDECFHWHARASLTLYSSCRHALRVHMHTHTRCGGARWATAFRTATIAASRAPTSPHVAAGRRAPRAPLVIAVMCVAAMCSHKRMRGVCGHPWLCFLACNQSPYSLSLRLLLPFATRRPWWRWSAVAAAVAGGLRGTPWARNQCVFTYIIAALICSACVYACELCGWC